MNPPITNSALTVMYVLFDQIPKGDFIVKLSNGNTVEVKRKDFKMLESDLVHQLYAKKVTISSLFRLSFLLFYFFSLFRFSSLYSLFVYHFSSCCLSSFSEIGQGLYSSFFSFLLFFSLSFLIFVFSKLVPLSNPQTTETGS